jgi:hypothetical protein
VLACTLFKWARNSRKSLNNVTHTTVNFFNFYCLTSCWRELDIWTTVTKERKKDNEGLRYEINISHGILTGFLLQVNIVTVCLWLPVFRQGDQGSSWYAVLGGQLDVRLEQTSKDSKEKVGLQSIFLNMHVSRQFYLFMLSYILPFLCLRFCCKVRYAGNNSWTIKNCS